MRPLTARARASAAAMLAVAVLVASCVTQEPATPSQSAAPAGSRSAEASPSPSPATGEIIPAPGSSSVLFAPNPAAIVVAIDPGHGGCLDWGVPNPWDNTVERAEKSDTLAIGLALRDLLVADGVTVVMTRTDDSALAGDDEPDFGCNGPPWRDVDGDGEAGFEETGRTRTRDELQARIDLANLARADVLVSIHINSLTQDGVAYRIAATQSFYDDETPWATGSASLGADVQSGVVAALDGVADYARQDRSTQAVAYYLISRQWSDGDTCEVAGDSWCKPHRGVQMPSVLTEVGSMSLRAESRLLAEARGREAVARGIFDGVRRWFDDRQLAVRYDLQIPDGEGGRNAAPVPGDGPPFWAPDLARGPAAPLTIRLTNTGTQPWPRGVQLVFGRAASDLPYLASPPDGLASVPVEIPSLAPGEAIVITVPDPSGEVLERQIAWYTLAGPAGPFTDLGSPALQVALGG